MAFNYIKWKKVWLNFIGDVGTPPANPTGEISDHVTQHEEGGDDELNVNGLPGVLDEEQHVIPSEARASISNIFGADGKAATDIDFNDNNILNLNVATQKVTQYDASGISPEHAEGKVFWDELDHTLALMSDIDGVTNQVGQENWIRAVNKTGDEIPNGSVVYITGASGNRVTVAMARASDNSQSRATMAIATHTIADNQVGFFTNFGIVRNVNTVGFADGVPLFLSDTPGVFAKVPPAQDHYTVIVGFVIRGESSENGSVFIKIVYMPTIEELSKMYVTSVQNYDLVQWDSVSGYWKNIPSNFGFDGKAIKNVDLDSNDLLNVNIIKQFGLFIKGISISVDDDNSFPLESGSNGYGVVVAGDNEEFVQFRWTIAGVVTLDANTANVSNSDTDGNLCIFFSAPNVIIKNRLGSAKIIKGQVYY